MIKFKRVLSILLSTILFLTANSNALSVYAELQKKETEEYMGLLRGGSNSV